MIDIYSDRRLGCARGDLEDDIEELLGGAGEVTGGGSGRSGWNIDVKLADDVDWEQWVIRLAEFLRKWRVPEGAYFMVFPPDWVVGTEGRRVEVFGK